MAKTKNNYSITSEKDNRRLFESFFLKNNITSSKASSSAISSVRNNKKKYTYLIASLLFLGIIIYFLSHYSIFLIPKKTINKRPLNGQSLLNSNIIQSIYSTSFSHTIPSKTPIIVPLDTRDTGIILKFNNPINLKDNNLLIRIKKPRNELLIKLVARDINFLSNSKKPVIIRVIPQRNDPVFMDLTASLSKETFKHDLKHIESLRIHFIKNKTLTSDENIFINNIFIIKKGD